VIRAIGGILFLVGALIMVFNIWMTIASPEEEAALRTDSAALVPAE
jgi:cytochrome c oxidase cbb3-type subunit 1